jgi:short-subunit dehydrogenase
MIEQKAKLQLDHMRGMTSEDVARATLSALAKGKNEVCLSFKGKLLVLFARFFPKVVDFFTKKKVRELFADEMAQRRQRQSTRETQNVS